MAVTVLYKKFKIIPVLVKWFNTETGFSSDDIAMFYLFQQSVPIANMGSATCVRQNSFTTSIIDLTRSQEQIWQGLDPKSCRYEIRKIKQLVDAGERIQIRNNPEVNKFIEIANRYICKKAYTKLLVPEHLEMYLKNNCGELITIYRDNQLIGGNFYIKDYPSRVRLLYSFNNRLDDEQVMKLSGAYMRYLHWEVMISKYKAEGFQCYDLGGVNLDRNSDTYGITKFKLSFGCNILQEYDYVFVSNIVISKFYKIYQKLFPQQ